MVEGPGIVRVCLHGLANVTSSTRRGSLAIPNDATEPIVDCVPDMMSVAFQRLGSMAASKADAALVDGDCDAWPPCGTRRVIGDIDNIGGY